jgi:ParB family transcriptional regulator, chromosome partitioning protein
MLSMVSFRDIKLASEAPPELGLQVRKSKDDPAAFAALKASIEHIGVLVPLLTVRHNGQLYALNGNRRLAVLREMYSDRAEIEVPIRELGLANRGAAEIAVMSNISLPLHPIDQYEVISAARNAGMEEPDIAARWAMTPRQVKQVLAYGALAPEIREAWRNGEIDAHTAAIFTLTDLEHQVRVFNKLKKQNDPGYGSVHEAIIGDKAGLSGLLTFVGIEAYCAAGGKVVEDLFGTSHLIDKPALVRKLADAKIEEACAQLVAVDGWAWAITTPITELHGYGAKAPAAKVKLSAEQDAELDELDRREENDEAEDSDEPSWMVRERVTANAIRAAYTADERAGLGCFVSIDGAGRLLVEPGKVKPADERSIKAAQRAADRKKKAKKAAAAAAGEPVAAVSNALMRKMSEWLTTAASHTALESPSRILQAAFIAGALSEEKTADIKIGGLDSKKAQSKDSFETIFLAMVEKPADDLAQVVAQLIAASFDFVVFRSDDKPLANPGIRALCESLPVARMQTWLLRTFGYYAEDYFGSVSKPAIVDAVAEMRAGDDAIKAVAKATKADAVKLAVDEASRRKWLPPELRTAHYSGPGSEIKKPTAKSAKKKRAKKK